MNRTTAVSLLGVVAALVIAAGHPVRATSDTGGTIVRIQVGGGSATRDGAGFLVHAAPKGNTTVYSFVTTSALLDPVPLGERRTISVRLRLWADDGTTLDASGMDLRFPGGMHAGLDIAVIRIESSVPGLRPLPITLDPPEPGDTFVVQGRQRSGPLTMNERVRFRSSRLLIGDRTITLAAELLGAPALTAEGAFGIVSQCSASRVPVVTLLSAAESFLTLAIPGWAPANRHSIDSRR
jgi:hypothetical protein